MGKKVSPHSLRIGITRTWDSLWYSKDNYKKQFLEDIKLREFLHKECQKAGVAKVEIVRTAGKIQVMIHAGKPGIIIGRSGDDIKKLELKLREKFGLVIDVNVREVRNADANAKLIAESIADQITRRFPYRRVCKMAVQRGMENGLKGIKILVSGRLNGVDIARKENYTEGTVPLHTLRANIDYATATAPTTYGQIGVKVWTYHGLVFKNDALNQIQ